MKKFYSILALCLCFVFLATSCKNDTPSTSASSGSIIGKQGNKKTLKIISGSENKELTPLMEKFASEKGISLDITYAGSIDIMRELGNEGTHYDAIWPASSLWISMGDTLHRVKHAQSTSITPVVFGIKKSLAQSLGFMRDDVRMKDILEAIKSKKLKFSMTSATQSNSGSSAYLSFLSGLAGSPDVLTKEHLQNDQLRTDIKDLLSGVDRSSGSSEWLKTLFLQGDFDAMVNYESLIITTNNELVKQGKEPLYVVYPVDGLAISDSPLGYIAKNDNKDKEEYFKEFQNYLMDPKIQNEIQKFGRRTGFEGIAEENKAIFNPDWGLKTDKVLSPIKTPSRDVIEMALDLYQTEFKKPALNIYVLDYSGSMKGEGEKQLKNAMSQILIQDNAKKNLLQASTKEENVIVFFSHYVINVVKASGNGQPLTDLYKSVESQHVNGGTNIYGALINALEESAGYNLENYSPAIILMSDGEHNEGQSFKDFKAKYDGMQSKIPIFTILFGSADEKQLTELATYTKGRIFDGRKDLINAFKNVKGYN